MKAAPNILWICLEDVSPWFGCYGDALARTPFIDQLAEQGTLYSRCYSPCPVCSPARSAMITGVYPSRLGLQHHRTDRTAYDANPLPTGFKTLPELLRDQGYQTFNAGKDDYNFGYDRERLYPGAYRTNFHWKQAERGVDWANLARSAPFFGQIQLLGGKRRHDPEVIANSPSLDAVALPTYYPDEPVFRQPIARHYGCINKVDTEVREIFANLKMAGVADNTVVFLFADHGWEGLRDKQFCYEGGTRVPLLVVAPRGYGIGTRGRNQDLVSSLDIAATTLALAGVAPDQPQDGCDLRDEGRSHDYLVSQRDRCDFTLDCIRSVVSDRYRYIRNYCPERPWLQPQYRSGWPEFHRWRQLAAAGNPQQTTLAFAVEERPEEEFYDLVSDPYQTVNRAGDPLVAVELDRHRAWLTEWREDVSDPGPVFPENQLLAALLRWGPETCDHPAYDPVKARYAELIRRYPEQRPWLLGDTSARRV